MPPLETQSPPDAKPAGPLLDRTPLWFRTPRAVWLVVLVLGMWFWYTTWMPLAPSGVWGDLAYGRWIWEHGRLPAYEPLVPLAEGMPVVNDSWLARLALYGAYGAAGIAGVVLLHSALLTIAFGLYLRVFYRLSGRLPIALAGLLLVAVVGMGQFSQHGPAAFGQVCFALVLFALWRPAELAEAEQGRETRDERREEKNRQAGNSRVSTLDSRLVPPAIANYCYWLVPATMLVWANAHGSFPLGIAILLCAALGSLIDARRTIGSWREAVREPAWRQRFLLAELGLAATFINPEGVGLWRGVFDTVVSPILAMFPEWQPLSAGGTVGVAFIGTVVLLMFALRIGRRALSAVEVLSLAVVGLLALRWSGMTAWWGPVVACVLVRQAVRRKRVPAVASDPLKQVTTNGAEPSGAAGSGGASPSQQTDAPRTGRNTVLALGLTWVAFAYSSVGLALLRGEMQPGAPPNMQAAATVEQNVSSATPRAQTQYLHANPPDGLVFNSYEWGDWLLWAGPRNMQVFATSRLEAMPGELWRHYLAIAEARTGWDTLLDFYGVEAVAVDFAQHRGLIDGLRESPAWRIVQEDARGIVAVRAAE